MFVCPCCMFYRMWFNLALYNWSVSSFIGSHAVPIAADYVSVAMCLSWHKSGLGMCSHGPGTSESGQEAPQSYISSLLTPFQDVDCQNDHYYAEILRDAKA